MKSKTKPISYTDAEKRLLKEDKAGQVLVFIMASMLLFILVMVILKEREKNLESVGIYKSEVNFHQIYLVVKDGEVVEKTFLEINDAKKYLSLSLNPIEYKIFSLFDFLNNKK